MSVTQISFKVSRQEMDVISEIADRAYLMARKAGVRYPQARWDTQMDVTAVHANGMPLRLSELLAADDFNFAHDVFGIRDHLNRATGQLERCFVPRFACPEPSR